MKMLKYTAELRHIPFHHIHSMDILFKNGKIYKCQIEFPEDISIQHSINPNHLLQSPKTYAHFPLEIQQSIVNSLEAALNFNPSEYLKDIRILYLELDHLEKYLYLLEQFFKQLGYSKIYSALHKSYHSFQTCRVGQPYFPFYFLTLFPEPDTHLIPRGFIDCFLNFYTNFRPIFNQARRILLKNKIINNRLTNLARIDREIIQKIKQLSPLTGKSQTEKISSLKMSHPNQTIIPDISLHPNFKKQMGDCWRRHWQYFCAIENSLQSILASIHAISATRRAINPVSKDYKFVTLSEYKAAETAGINVICQTQINSQDQMSIRFQHWAWFGLLLLKQILPTQTLDDLELILNSFGFKLIQDNIS